jgi:hypothetical protein
LEVAAAAAPSYVTWLNVYVAVHVVEPAGSKIVIRLVLPGVQLKAVHLVEASDVLCSLVLPMLLTVMVAVTTASAGRVTQHRQHKQQSE